MTATYADLDEFVLDISDETENRLQDDHEREFIPPAPRIVYIDRCVTCNDRPLWGCALTPCEEGQSCFIICPSCGRYGNTEPEAGFVPDEALATILRNRLSIPQPRS